MPFTNIATLSLDTPLNPMYVLPVGEAVRVNPGILRTTSITLLAPNFSIFFWSKISVAAGISISRVS